MIRIGVSQTAICQTNFFSEKVSGSSFFFYFIFQSMFCTTFMKIKRATLILVKV